MKIFSRHEQNKINNDLLNQNYDEIKFFVHFWDTIFEIFGFSRIPQEKISESDKNDLLIVYFL